VRGPLAERAAAVVAGPRADPDLTAAEALEADLAARARRARSALADAGPADAHDRAAALVEITELRLAVRAHVADRPDAVHRRIHAALERLRRVERVAELLPAAARELAGSCGFRRAVVSRIRNARWRAEAVWMAPDLDPATSAATAELLTTTWFPLGPGGLETGLVHRRTAGLVAPDSPKTDPGLMEVSRTPGYVVAPVTVGGRPIGFLQADCGDDGRELTTLDLEAMRAFAMGFGLVFERVARLEGLADRRRRLQDAADAAVGGLEAIGSEERTLVRGATSGTVDHVADATPPGPSSVELLLTAREREVLDHLVTGARNGQIAARLVISEDTVKSHVRTITRKLHASNRADAVARYLRLVMRDGR